MRDKTYKVCMFRLSRRAKLLALIFSLLSLFHCQTQHQSFSSYLILYALDAEGQVLMEKMSILDNQKILGRTVNIGNLSGVDIVLAESGAGMTNAAMTTQKLIDEYHPKGVIFIGIAGAIDNVVHIGDIVVCESWVTHDYGDHGADGLRPYGIKVYSPQSDSMIRTSRFSVDSSMYKAVQEMTEDVIPFQNIGERTPKLLIGGVGVSGNAFIDNFEKRIWLYKTFKALIVDKESAAVAQVCSVNHIPFIIFRSASDLAGGSGSDSARDEMQEFFEVAAKNSSMLIIKFLEHLSLSLQSL